MGREFLSLKRGYQYIFFCFCILVFILAINYSLTLFLQNEAVKRNSLVFKIIHLKKVLLYCESFSINTSYIKVEECKEIKSKINNIENKLNEDFKVLNFYIKTTYKN